jgi:hypothetical protein
MLSVVMSIAVSRAECEKGFSAMNLLVTFTPAAYHIEFKVTKIRGVITSEWPPWVA